MVRIGLIGPQTSEHSRLDVWQQFSFWDVVGFS